MKVIKIPGTVEGDKQFTEIFPSDQSHCKQPVTGNEWPVNADIQQESGPEYPG